MQRKLIDNILDGGTSRASTGVHPSRQDLDIEEPPGYKRLVEERLDLRGSPEELRAALRVIERNTQDQGRGSGKDAPEVMPYGAALDGPAQELYSRSENHQQVRAVI